ncbi:hypothetical protein M1615_00650 [Patescibacteria group bacterium]|nr:hypothetical protein [Patescibacteria group bacterium]MCL5010208.1 hypothetical protein [Patescibacteria group bacterium]
MSAEVDFREGMFGIPEDIKQQYRDVIPLIIKINPQFSPQEALDHIKAVEGARKTILFGVRLSDKATVPQRWVFDRKLLKLKEELQIISDDERQRLDRLNGNFASTSEKLTRLRGITPEEADDLLMSVLNYRGVGNFDEAIERLTKGPKIIGFEKTDLFEFDFSNDELREMLKSSFGLDAIVKSRLMEVAKVGGFPVQCRDVEFGNQCVTELGARWEGGFLVLPDRAAYEQAEMQLEDVTDPKDLEHSFKLRAATDSGSGFATVKVREFAVEQSSHFDYLQGLPLRDQCKMRAYFLGIIAHETVHAMQAFGIDKEILDEYYAVAEEEKSETLDHQFVSEYVDRHYKIYKSNEHEALSEDLAEAVRIYLTNSNYLKQHFPQRYVFIKQRLSFVKENAILDYLAPIAGAFP